MDFSEKNHYIDIFADFYFLYIVFPVLYLIGTYHIYLKQKSSLKPQVTLIIIALIDLSLSSIGLGIYIFFLRADVGINSGVMRLLKCLITLLAFFKSLDNILGQVDSFLAIWRPHYYSKVNGDTKRLNSKIQNFQVITNKRILVFSSVLKLLSGSLIMLIGRYFILNMQFIHHNHDST